MQKTAAFVLLALLLVAAPVLACSINQGMMQDECYSSCVSWALHQHHLCTQGCWDLHCAPNPNNECDVWWGSCVQGACETDKCNSLRDCEDFCHDW